MARNRTLETLEQTLREREMALDDVLRFYAASSWAA